MEKKRINSRNKGIHYEQALVREFKTLFKTDKIYSSRAESKRMDDAGVDIVGEIPIHVQAKAMETTPPAHKILANMPTDKPRVIFWKKNYKPQIVIMEAETFLEIMLDIVDKKD